MAYPITAEALDLFTNSYRQVVEISFNGVNENIKLTEQDISLGGFSVNRYCVSGNKIEIGSAIAAELALSLDNSDGRFDEVFFEGAELYVRVGSKKWEARRWEHADYHYIPFGYFTIDEAPRKLAKITLSALDRMVLFDKAVDLVDKVGVAHPTIITDFTFTLNTSTSIGGKGETATKSGYASANPLTKAEAAIINAIKQEQNKVLNDRVQSVLALNELISNALGLFVTPVEQENGSTIYYMHNQPNLEESQNIFTMTSEGIAWTADGWNDGNPVWSYGATAAGDALFRMLSAEGIEVGKVGEDYNIEMTPRAFRIYYREMLVTEIEADEMTIPKAMFTTYAECGKIRLVPHTENGVVMGTNMVFID